jgi:hypothetical protein
MTSKAKKNGSIIFILVLVIAGAVYFLWNKPHKDVNSATGIQINAVDLYQSFITDSAKANTTYIDKVVEVSGVIQSTSVNQQQQKIVSLKTNSGGAINCTMEQKNTAVKEGAAVKIKGICSGLGEGDAALGIMGDVYLIRCYIPE